MGTDALTNAILDAISKAVLPRLTRALETLEQPHPALAEATQDLRTTLIEIEELLSLWRRINARSDFCLQHVGTVSPLVEHAAAAAGPALVQDHRRHHEAGELTTGEGDATNSSVFPTDPRTDHLMNRSIAAIDAPKPTSSTSSAGDFISDEEAYRLLAAMDAPLATTTPPSSDLDAGTLAMMAAFPSDGEPNRSLAISMPAAKADEITHPHRDSMSDEEAHRLLAAMDAPPQTEAELPHATDAAGFAMQTNMPTDSELKNNCNEIISESTDPDLLDHAEIDKIQEFSDNDFASDPIMLQDFLTNSEELMQTLDATILELEQSPDDRETIETIFRAAHTLKGAAGMFGYQAIERVMHGMESLFDKVRKGQLRPDSNTIDVVFQGLDTLRTLFAAVRKGEPSGIKITSIVQALALATQGRYRKDSTATLQGKAQTNPNEVSPRNHPVSANSTSSNQPSVGSESVEKVRETNQATIRVDLERLDALVNLVGELVIDRTRFASIEESIRTSLPHLPITSNMSETVQLFGRHMNEIHEIIMKIRMVPIGNTFNKFSRIVRDLARQLGKQIDLIIEGEDTELDKTLVEQISDPLIHLIRNACDHGIEWSTLRTEQGKPPIGTIRLSAHQEGNHIIVKIADDGKGLDVEKIRCKAIERGLISADLSLTRPDIFNLIFEPGFSTADQVTTVSGRGVGMDVVRKQISKLKGVIDLDSEMGRGTVITIRLPLTLAIVQSLLVETQREIFAIPLSTVIESVRIRPDEVQLVGDIEVIRRHEKVLPLLYLNDALDLKKRSMASWYGVARTTADVDRQMLQARSSHRHERLFVVIVGSGDRRFGIVVDQLLQQQEMVIKSLGPLMSGIPCVAGGAVLGNGEVVLVLDIQELEDRFRSKNRRVLQAA